MKRDLVQFARKEYDLLVIGGGIYGACVAWDAALRGLSVALVDKGDFGHATSANSLKIIHGGLRYLQDGNLRRVRTMACERATWLRIAPHLVHPLPCLMPTSEKPSRHKLALGAALRLNDWVSYDRNRSMDPQKHLPNGRIISRAACLEWLPEMTANGVTGGAIWHDAQIYNSERLLLSIVRSAVRAGADAANYVEVTGFLQAGTSVRGVNANDGLTGQAFDIRAKLVVNCTGAWVDAVLGLLNDRAPQPRCHLSTAMNLVTRQILPKYAVGIPSYAPRNGGNGSSQILFIVPWHQYSLIGTMHYRYSGAPQNFYVVEEAIQDFVDQVNAAYPGAALKRESVYHIHAGFLPAEPNGRPYGVNLVREGRVHDHQQEDGLAGLITVIGVKYTTARSVARQVVDLAVRKLGYKALPCRTHQTPVYGGQIDRFNEFLARAIAQSPFGLSPEISTHLVYNYGSEFHHVFKYLDENPAWRQLITNTSPVIKAEVIRAIREEMAQKLTDVIQRRTELGAAGLPDESGLQICAALMAAELGWDQTRQEQEIKAVRAAYATTPRPAREKIGAI